MSIGLDRKIRIAPPGRPGRFAREKYVSDTVITLETPPDVSFTRTLTTAAEAVAQAAGLASRENMRLQLAVEEFFTYLAVVTDPENAMSVRLEAKRHQARAVFEVAAQGLALGGLNIHSTACLDQEGEPARMLGLHLVTRMADRFHIAREGGRFTLTVEMDKAYPPSPSVEPSASLAAPYEVSARQDPALWAHSAALAFATYPAWLRPASFAAADKFADMAAEGAVSALVATDKAGSPAGLICWKATSPKALDFSGPFVFGPDKALVAQALCDKFLESVAREGREIVFSLRPTPDTPRGYFETLGRMSVCHAGVWEEQPAVFRHLREDMGAMIWAHPRMTPFLNEFYDRLALSREIVSAVRADERVEGQSLITVSADPGRGLAVLKPLLDGADMADNLAKSVAVLRDKGVKDIRVHLDLAFSWQGALGGMLQEAGFHLKIVLPQAERSDLAVYQHASAG